MILTEEQREKFREAVKPLVEFLNNNCHPHVRVIIDDSTAELVEGICHIIINDYLHD